MPQTASVQFTSLLKTPEGAGGGSPSVIVAQGILEFKASLGCVVTLKPSWATRWGSKQTNNGLHKGPSM